MITVTCRRADGTVVIVHPGTGLPYHVLPTDSLWGDIPPEDIAAAPMDSEEPILTPPPVREPTKTELIQQLQSLAAKIEALP